MVWAQLERLYRFDGAQHRVCGRGRAIPPHFNPDRPEPSRGTRRGDKRTLSRKRPREANPEKILALALLRSRGARANHRSPAVAAALAVGSELGLLTAHRAGRIP